MDTRPNDIRSFMQDLCQQVTVNRRLGLPYSDILDDMEQLAEAYGVTVGGVLVKPRFNYKPKTIAEWREVIRKNNDVADESHDDFFCNT